MATAALVVLALVTTFAVVLADATGRPTGDFSIVPRDVGRTEFEQGWPELAGTVDRSFDAPWAIAVRR